MQRTDGWGFVMGPERSGTTLVARLLDFHPDCICLGETGIVDCFHRIIDPPGMPSEGAMPLVRWTTQKRLNDGTDSQLPGYAGWPLPQIRSDIPPRKHVWNTVSVNDFVRGMCEGLRACYPPVAMFGDKWIPYLRMADWIRRVFPEAVFVRTERDTQAIVESLIRMEWAWPQITEPAARRAIATTHGQAQVALAAGVRAEVVLRLEDINEAPERECERLIRGVGLDWATYPLELAVEQVQHGRVS